MKHLKVFESETPALDKLNQVKTIGMQQRFENPAYTDVKTAFFLMTNAINELAARIKNIEDHAAGHGDM